MPAGRSNAAALLQKVNSQLRGERVPLKTKEEDELAVYLNSLNAKTQQARNVNFEEFGDISISSGADARNSLTPRGRRSASPANAAPAPVSSKYLKKKKPAENVAASMSGGEEELEENVGRDSRAGIVIAGSKKVTPAQPSKGASALDKANALTNKIKGRALSGPPLRRHISGDSESEGSVRGSDFGPRPGSADASVGRDGPKFLKSRRAVADDDRQGVRSPSPQPLKRSFSNESQAKQRRTSKSRGEIVRTLGQEVLTSDEESLAEFIYGLSASESSVKRPQNLVAKKQQKWRKTGSSPLRKTPSPVQRPGSPSPFMRSPSPLGKLKRSLSQDSDLPESMASEMHGGRPGRRDSGSSDDFKVNLMDVASLLPASPRPSSGKRKSSGSRSKGSKHQASKSSSSNFKAQSPDVFKGKGKEKKKTPSKSKKSSLKKSDSATSLFESFGIHMVDELLDYNTDKKQNAEIDLTDDSEIQTEKSDERKRMLKRQESESEIITELGASHKKQTPFRPIHSAASISERIGVVSSVQKKQKKYDSSGTTDVEDYSESFESDWESSETRTPSASYSPRDKKSRSRTKKRTSHASSSHKSRDHKVVMEEKRVDISAADPRGGMHHWNATQMGISVSGPYGLQYVDPKPVATHVVSADALEALTAYSPNMMALQEMMKTQLDLVRNFVDIQRRIYQSCMDGLSYDFKYTTLEDTKEYIRKNRKPRLTFQEALKLVEQEEGLTA